MTARVVLGLALVATALLYWIGLDGPFLLDDMENLRPVQAWLAGQSTWQQAVFGNESGPLGRPLAMTSFLASAALGGAAPGAFKLGNLLVHLAVGVLGWLVLRRALARDARLAGSAELIASIVVALWLLHPLNVSTVLYVVQRMAQLSALFVLASLWVYLVARQQLVAGHLRRGLAGLFVLFPLLLAAGLLSKENAIVAPALCLVLELAYFGGQPRPRRIVEAFFGVFLLAPVLVATVLVALQPDYLLGGYVVRDFTPLERLLSQPRALMDYAGTVLFPRTPLLGVYTDDFQVSTGLLSPPATLWALLVLVGVSVAAFAARRRAPSVFAGWFFFLVAHGLESTILPLELYFEHRNYLPALGLLLAVAGLAALLPRNLATNVLSPRQLGLLAAAGFALVFAFGTHGRARIWQHEDTLVAEALKAHPASLRANLAQATIALRTGRVNESYDAMSRLLASDNPRYRLLGRIHWVTLDCITGRGANPADLRAAVAGALPKLTLAEMQAFELLARVSGENDCGIVGPGLIAGSIDRIVDAATAQPDSLAPKWRSRLVASQLYARAGRWDEALPQARLAWQPSNDPAAGAFLVRAYVKNGRYGDAARTLDAVDMQVSEYDRFGQAELLRLRNLVDTRPPTP